MFMLMGPHTARGNIPWSIEQSVEWLTDLMRYMRAHNLTRVEPRPEAVEAWTAEVIRIASMLLSSQVNSWQTGIDRNVEGKNVRHVLGDNGSAVRYREKAEEVAAKGYQEFAFDRTG
jgi:hypothetical protein